jgi:hypothetical protein
VQCRCPKTGCWSDGPILTRAVDVGMQSHSPMGRACKL